MHIACIGLASREQSQVPSWIPGAVCSTYYSTYYTYYVPSQGKAEPSPLQLTCQGVDHVVLDLLEHTHDTSLWCLLHHHLSSGGTLLACDHTVSHKCHPVSLSAVVTGHAHGSHILTGSRHVRRYVGSLQLWTKVRAGVGWDTTVAHMCLHELTALHCRGCSQRLNHHHSPALEP